MRDMTPVFKSRRSIILEARIVCLKGPWATKHVCVYKVHEVHVIYGGGGQHTTCEWGSCSRPQTTAVERLGTLAPYLGMCCVYYNPFITSNTFNGPGKFVFVDYLQPLIKSTYMDDVTLVLAEKCCV